jgi:hypothetical protein
VVVPALTRSSQVPQRTRLFALNSSSHYFGQ